MYDLTCPVVRRRLIGLVSGIIFSVVTPIDWVISRHFRFSMPRTTQVCRVVFALLCARVHSTLTVCFFTEFVCRYVDALKSTEFMHVVWAETLADDRQGIDGAFMRALLGDLHDHGPCPKCGARESKRAFERWALLLLFRINRTADDVRKCHFPLSMEIVDECPFNHRSFILSLGLPVAANISEQFCTWRTNIGENMMTGSCEYISHKSL